MYHHPAVLGLSQKCQDWEKAIQESANNKLVIHDDIDILLAD